MQTEKDGVPRYAVLRTSALRNVCADHESVRDMGVLCIKPDRTSPWFYLNSSLYPLEEGKVPNVLTSFPLSDRNTKINRANAAELLRDPCNAAVFRVGGGVEDGEELRISYPIALDLANSDVDGSVSDAAGTELDEEADEVIVAARSKGKRHRTTCSDSNA